MSRQLFKILSLLILISCCIYLYKNQEKVPSRKLVAIVQLIDHPALNKTREGLMEGLHQQDPTIEIQWQTAQGSPALVNQICEAFVGQKASVIVALGTTAAQGALQSTKNTSIPVIFASVTDPQGAGLLPYATGVSNYIDVEQQLDFMLKISPSLKNLGTLYNPGETFADSMLDKLEKACQKKGITLTKRAVTKSGDIMAAAQSIADQVEGIFINNDNLILAAFSSLAMVCDQYKIPTFSSDVDSLDQGAIGVLGPDQYDLGKQAASMVEKVLKNPQLVTSLPVSYPKKLTAVFNKEKINRLSLTYKKGE